MLVLLPKLKNSIIFAVRMINLSLSVLKVPRTYYLYLTSKSAYSSNITFSSKNEYPPILINKYLLSLGL